MVREEYTALQGCKASRADAKHDFHSLFGAIEIQRYVDSNLPDIALRDCTPLTEDNFLKGEILKDSANMNGYNFLDETRGNLSDEITARYSSQSCERPQHKYVNVDGEKEWQKSYIQDTLVKMGVDDTIFIVCDVAYANVREDLRFISHDNNFKVYWVQNAQTLYDPASKSSWHSDDTKTPAGIEYDNHFRKDDSRFLFCWEDPEKSRIKYFPN